MTVPARKTHYQAVHQISGQGGFGQLAGLLGVIPAGSLLIGWHFFTSFAFNSTTNTLSLGTTPGGVQILPPIDCKAIQRLDAVFNVPFQAAALTADTPIYYTLASTGPAPTQGTITAWFDYIPNIG